MLENSSSSSICWTDGKAFALAFASLILASINYIEWILQEELILLKLFQSINHYLSLKIICTLNKAVKLCLGPYRYHLQEHWLLIRRQRLQMLHHRLEHSSIELRNTKLDLKLIIIKIHIWSLRFLELSRTFLLKCFTFCFREGIGRNVRILFFSNYLFFRLFSDDFLLMYITNLIQLYI